MTPHEKYLYHQIHPLKLLTDWSAGLLALYPLWRHQLALGLAILLIPPPVASWLVIRHVNLERQRQSAFGRYLARSMPPSMELVRLAGMVVMAIAAWNRSVALVFVGVAVVLLGWSRGLWLPAS